MSTAPRHLELTVTVNGEGRRLRATTLAEALHELGFEGRWLGTALNGDLVPRADRAAHPVREGDRIEILSPMQGG